MPSMNNHGQCILCLKILTWIDQYKHLYVLVNNYDCVNTTHVYNINIVTINIK